MPSEKFDEKRDDKIKNSLYKGAYRPTNAMLARNQKILEKTEEIEKNKLPGKTYTWEKALGLVAAAMVIIFLLSIFTQPGQAALEKLRKHFEPERMSEYEVEGDKENIGGMLQQSEKGYAIYYDKELYQVVEDKQADRIVMKEDADENPEVYMEISQEALYTPEEIASMLELELKDSFSQVGSVTKLDEPIEALYIHAVDEGNRADDHIVEYYLVDNKKGGTFIIKLKYFLEAAEGHGARFFNMLKNFTIVDTE